MLWQCEIRRGGSSCRFQKEPYLWSQGFGMYLESSCSFALGTCFRLVYWEQTLSQNSQLPYKPKKTLIILVKLLDKSVLRILHMWKGQLSVSCYCWKTWALDVFLFKNHKTWKVVAFLKLGMCCTYCGLLWDLHKAYQHRRVAGKFCSEETTQPSIYQIYLTTEYFILMCKSHLHSTRLIFCEFSWLLNNVGLRMLALPCTVQNPHVTVDSPKTYL